MSQEPEACYLPDFLVSRVGTLVRLHCGNENDAIILWEIFKELTIGKPLWIGKAEDENGE